MSQQQKNNPPVSPAVQQANLAMAQLLELRDMYAGVRDKLSAAVRRIDLTIQRLESQIEASTIDVGGDLRTKLEEGLAALATLDVDLAQALSTPKLGTAAAPYIISSSALKSVKKGDEQRGLSGQGPTVGDVRKAKKTLLPVLKEGVKKANKERTKAKKEQEKPASKAPKALGLHWVGIGLMKTFMNETPPSSWADAMLVAYPNGVKVARLKGKKEKGQGDEEKTSSLDIAIEAALPNSLTVKSFKTAVHTMQALYTNPALPAVPQVRQLYNSLHDRYPTWSELESVLRQGNMLPETQSATTS